MAPSISLYITQSIKYDTINKREFYKGCDCMKRKSLLIICLAAVLVVVLSAAILHSSLEYKVMANTEMLKAQLKEEHQAYSTELFEHIEVERPWYSLSPSEWTFVVTLSPNSKAVYYRLVDGVFVVSQP